VTVEFGYSPETQECGGLATGVPGCLGPVRVGTIVIGCRDPIDIDLPPHTLGADRSCRSCRHPFNQEIREVTGASQEW
jgi:hypothetical protein